MRKFILLPALLLSLASCSNDSSSEGANDNASTSTEANKPAPVAIANTVDPVCGMHVTAADATGHAEHEGKTLGFCSEECAEEFKKDPAQYAAKLK